MTKTCKNCKYFRKFDKTIIYRLKSIAPDYDDFAFEERLVDLYLDAHADSHVFDKKEEGKDKFGLCSKNKILYSQKLDKEKEWAGQYNDCLVYWDAEDYEAGFRVGEDFGCIHFEPLNEDEDSEIKKDIQKPEKKGDKIGWNKERCDALMEWYQKTRPVGEFL